MAKWTYVGRETTEYGTGDRAVEDVFENDKGDLVVNTYNIPSDGKNYTHTTMDEHGNTHGEHGPDGRTWKERKDRD